MMPPSMACIDACIIAIVERALRRHHHGNNITKPYHSY